MLPCRPVSHPCASVVAVRTTSLLPPGVDQPALGRQDYPHSFEFDQGDTHAETDRDSWRHTRADRLTEGQPCTLSSSLLLCKDRLVPAKEAELPSGLAFLVVGPQRMQWPLVRLEIAQPLDFWEGTVTKCRADSRHQQMPSKPVGKSGMLRNSSAPAAEADAAKAGLRQRRSFT